MESKDDDKAFIFTLKNPHGVEPTRFMKRNKNQSAIICYPDNGPIFGSERNSIDISIGNHCNKKNSCSFQNDNRKTYEYHPLFKSLLYVNDESEDESKDNLIYFSVLDYEVYSIDYENQKTVYSICKHPDVIWSYVQTQDISRDSLKHVEDDTELLHDFDIISGTNRAIRLKISQYCLKNPSELLPETQLVNQQYDAKLREWLGDDYKWKLLYRASEHGYSAESFHEYCDDKGPTLIVIKSSGGWIFGGYTTQSWKVVHPDESGSICCDYDIVIINSEQERRQTSIYLYLEESSWSRTHPLFDEKRK